MKIAAIEVGTNSTKFIIVDLLDSGSYNLIERINTINRLSSKMYGRNIITEASMSEGLKVIDRFIKMSKESKAELVSIHATSVLRDADNSKEFISRVRDAYGIEIEILSGEKEAYLAFKACSHIIEDKRRNFVVIDIGGGSTEVIVGSKSNIEFKKSVDIGAIRLTEMFIKNDPITKEELDNMSKFIMTKIKDADISGMNKLYVIGTGGTIKNIGTMFLKENYENKQKVNGLIISREQIEVIYNNIVSMSIEEKKRVTGLNPKRADVIISGILILLVTMRVNCINEIAISALGVLEGYIEDYIISQKGNLFSSSIL